MSDEEHLYKPYTFGLGFKITDEALGEEFAAIRSVLDEAAYSLMRMTTLRMDVQLGAGLSPEDAKFLVKALDEALDRANAKPAPPMLNTLRAWLAAKIRPTDYEDYE